MVETKKNMIKRLSRPNTPRMAMVLAHGTYASREAFSIPAGIIVIFVSRTARYLPQSVINTAFYNVFTNTQRIHNILSNTNSNPPNFLQGWERRVYGPGDTCPNIVLQMSDPNWGMGLHTLPMAQNELRTTPGTFMGQTMKLSELMPLLSGSGILFVTSCRGTTNLPNLYQNLTANYSFPEWSLEYNLQRQNEISSRMLKRRREGGVSNNSGNNAGNAGRLTRVRVGNNGRAGASNNGRAGASNNGSNNLGARLNELNANLRAANLGNRLNIRPYMKMIYNIKMNTFGKRVIDGQNRFFPVAAARRYTKFFPANMSNANVARWVNSIKRSNNSLTNNINELHRAVNSGSVPVENNWKNNNRLSKRIFHRIHTIENRRST